MSLLLKSYAKINLALDVGAKRPDGFHEIQTIFYQISLADQLEFKLAAAGSLRLEILEGSAPSGSDNIIFKTADRFLPPDTGLEIRLRKRIPMQAGLGGGSSNAAATLVALQTMFKQNDDMASSALSLGSDVPYFLKGGIARGDGRGELLTPIASNLMLHLLLVKPAIGVPTAWAYAEIDREQSCGKRNFTHNVQTALEAGNRQDVLKSLGNDFESAVLRRFPEIGRLKTRLEQVGAEAALLTGSGSVVFGVFPSMHDAMEAAKSFPDVWHAAVSGVPGGTDG